MCIVRQGNDVVGNGSMKNVRGELMTEESEIREVWTYSQFEKLLIESFEWNRDLIIIDVLKHISMSTIYFLLTLVINESKKRWWQENESSAAESGELIMERRYVKVAIIPFVPTAPYKGALKLAEIAEKLRR